MRRLRIRAAAVAAALALGPLTLVACGGGPASTVSSASPSASADPDPTPGTTSAAAPTTSAAARPSARATPSAAGRPGTDVGPGESEAAPTTAPTAPVAGDTGPVIVIDPGHSPQITSTDPATGLDDSTYENDPEMADVFAVSLLVRQRLQADGYTVVMTKNAVDDRVSLGQRAAIANRVHAALAISVHDQAGANGGIPFAGGNNIVYTQTVGKYRMTPDGRKVTFTDAAVADTSHRYGAVFQAQRARVEGHAVTVMPDTGYDQGTRGHPGGNMWIVQLLSTVPWIYNEAGGNSPGQVGLSAADRQRYAGGLVAGVEACVPR
ncbi:N-acetylmuramoyl-L-alanine amidase family protein [Jatrophihabitans sp. YIM 134969]